MAETFLARIVAATRADLTARQAELPLDGLRAYVASAPPLRPRRRVPAPPDRSARQACP